MTIHELESKVRELHQLQALIDEATAEAESIKDVIKASMTAQGVDEVRAGEYKVSWKPVTASRFDSKAFKADHADLYGQYSKTITARRFCVA